MTSEIKSHHEKTCFGNQTENCREGEYLKFVENFKQNYCASLARNQFFKDEHVSLLKYYPQKSDEKNNASDGICNESKGRKQNLDYWVPLKKSKYRAI